MATYLEDQVKLELFKTILANPSNSYDKLASRIDSLIKDVEKMAKSVLTVQKD